MIYSTFSVYVTADITIHLGNFLFFSHIMLLLVKILSLTINTHSLVFKEVISSENNEIPLVIVEQ